ncbi:ABC transporter permease [bacterium]|nr:ABC transporter permease [bacterium]
MFRFAPYIWKGMIRHRARTAMTIAGAAVGVFVFCCVGAVQQGLNRLTQGVAANQSLIVFQENRFCPTTSRLPQDYATTIAKLDGVVGVVPMQVYTNNCRASLDIIVFNGAPPTDIRKFDTLRLIEGGWESFESRSDAAIVGIHVARRRGLSVGQSFTIGEVTVQIVGIFESTVANEENLIYTHLDFLQRAAGSANVGVCTLFEVLVREGVDPDRLATTIDSTLHSGPIATTTRRKGAFQASTLADLVDLIEFAHWLGYASVGLVLSLLATTTLMATQDRIKEHAVLQVLGVRPTRVARFVIAESLMICLVGGTIGMLIALTALAWGGFAIGAEGATIAFEPSWSLAVSGLAVSLLVGLLAGLVPALKVATADLVPSLNQ